MLRSAGFLLLSALLGAQQGPWLRDSLADRYPGPFPPEIPSFGPLQRQTSKPGQATVIISEAAAPWERFQGFKLDLATDLRKTLVLPPPRLHAVELSDFMSTDPSHPERGDIVRAIHALAQPAVPAHLNPPR